jgi:hypothetical protein
MFVRARGAVDGKAMQMTWHLLAEGDDGPYIPSMASEAIVRRLLDGKRPEAGSRPGTLSFAERIEIDLAEPREDHCILKLACRRIAGAGKRYSAGVFERERARPAFGYKWT